jgi:hypothetical protein
MPDEKKEPPDLYLPENPERSEPFHAINTYKKCPVDQTHEGYEVRNYDEMWRDGDIHCKQCGAYIRMYDAG